MKKYKVNVNGTVYEITVEAMDGAAPVAAAPAAAAPAPAPETPPAPAPAPADPPPKAITLEEVRAVLAERSHDGYTDQVRGLLQKYGAEKLSGVDPKHYAALLKDAEVLGHAT